MEIHSILGHNLSTLKAVQKLLEQFIVADVSEDGKLDFHEFCSMLKLKRGSKQSERIYAVFNDGEAIDFRHFGRSLELFSFRTNSISTSFGNSILQRSGENQHIQKKHSF